MSEESEIVHTYEADATSTTSSVSSPKSAVAQATEDFLLNEKNAVESPSVAESDVPCSPSSAIDEEVPLENNHQPEPVEPHTPVNSESSAVNEEEEEVPHQEPSPPQVVEVSLYSEPTVVAQHQEEVAQEPVPPAEPVEPQLTNGHSNGECKFEPRAVDDVKHNSEEDNPPVLNGTIANELVLEDYKLPEVVEVKKHFEHVEPVSQNGHVQAPPKKGALSTRLDLKSIRNSYEDVRFDGSETQWAVFKFEGTTIVTSATGSDFTEFKSQFGDAERAFGYIRVQTGDEMSKRAKFILVTWVGPSVSVLKRAKMSTDKALIKDVVSNFAVELQTENISEINLQHFESVLDKAAGAHYGTGVMS